MEQLSVPINHDLMNFKIRSSVAEHCLECVRVWGCVKEITLTEFTPKVRNTTKTEEEKNSKYQQVRNTEQSQSSHLKTTTKESQCSPSKEWYQRKLVIPDDEQHENKQKTNSQCSALGRGTKNTERFALWWRTAFNNKASALQWWVISKQQRKPVILHWLVLKQQRKPVLCSDE